MRFQRAHAAIHFSVYVPPTGHWQHFSGVSNSRLMGHAYTYRTVSGFPCWFFMCIVMIRYTYIRGSSCPQSPIMLSLNPHQRRQNGWVLVALAINLHSTVLLSPNCARYRPIPRTVWSRFFGFLLCPPWWFHPLCNTAETALVGFTCFLPRALGPCIWKALVTDYLQCA